VFWTCSMAGRTFNGIWQRDFFLCLLINEISSKKLLYRYVTYLFFYHAWKNYEFRVTITRSKSVAAQPLNKYLNLNFAYFIFLVVNSNTPPLDYVIGVYLVIISSFLLASAAGLWFPLAGWMFKFYACIFYHWSILCCLGLVRHSVFIIG
jgi:hypothetical protein